MDTQNTTPRWFPSEIPPEKVYYTNKKGDTYPVLKMYVTDKIYFSAGVRKIKTLLHNIEAAKAFVREEEGQNET